MEKTTERDVFLKAAKNVDAVIWVINDSYGHSYKAVTDEGVYAFGSSHAELTAKLEKENMTWIDGVLWRPDAEVER